MRQRSIGARFVLWEAAVVDAKAASTAWRPDSSGLHRACRRCERCRSDRMSLRGRPLADGSQRRAAGRRSPAQRAGRVEPGRRRDRRIGQMHDHRLDLIRRGEAGQRLLGLEIRLNDVESGQSLRLRRARATGYRQHEKHAQDRDDDQHLDQRDRRARSRQDICTVTAESSFALSRSLWFRSHHLLS